MDQLVILTTAIIFYFIGRYAGKEHEVISHTIKTTKKLLHPPKRGIIDYPTASQTEYKGSEQEKIDQDFIKRAKEAGL